MGQGQRAVPRRPVPRLCVSKRTPGKFERNPRDYYPTPDKAIAPLLRHLQPGTRFIEPCAGDGRMIEALQIAGHVCVEAFDIEPQDKCIAKVDALAWERPKRTAYGQYTIITNPPWWRPLLHDLIPHLSRQHPTWLLFDADWAHTRQAVGLEPVDGKKRDLLRYCQRIVSVGRVKWIEDSKHQSVDNAAWYLFHDREPRGETQFFGRTAPSERTLFNEYEAQTERSRAA